MKHEPSRYEHPLPDRLSAFTLTQWARRNEGLEPLPTDEELNETLKRAGITRCLEKSYPWAPA